MVVLNSCFVLLLLYQIPIVAEMS